MKLIERTARKIALIIMVFGMIVGVLTTNVVAVSLSEDPVTLLVNSDAVNDTATRVEEATYKTFQGAYNKALDGDTIKLETDIVSYVGFGIYKNFILDLNGNKLIGPSSMPIIELMTYSTNTGSIEIKDTSIDKEGIITSTYAGFSNLIINRGTGTLKVSSGKIQSSYGRAIYSENGVLEIAGGTITSNSTSINDSPIAVGGTTDIYISGGEILSEHGKAIVVFGTGRIIMTDGLISSKTSAISGSSINAGYRRSIEISGGTISSTDEFSIYDSFTNSTISGGNLLSGINLRSMDSTSTISGDPNIKIFLHKYSNKIIIAGNLTGEAKSIKIDGTNLEGAEEEIVIASAASEEFVDISKFELVNLDNMILKKSGSNLILVYANDTDKIAEAKIAIESALTNFEVSNTTTADQLLNIATDATLHGVSVEWDNTSGFNKIDATSSAAGSITGTFKISLNDVNETVVLNKVIEQLPLSDADKIAQAKTIIETFIANLTVSNATTEQEMLNQLATLDEKTLHGVTVGEDETTWFSKTNATSTAAGSITITLNLELNSESDIVSVNLTIAQLPLSDAEKVAAAKTAIETALANVVVSNTTTAEQLLKIATDATLYGATVEWDNTNGFNKVNATISTAGSVKGTFTIALNDVSETINITKVIKLLPVNEVLKLDSLIDTPTGVKLEGSDGIVFDLETELVVTTVMETLEKETMDRFALSVINLENDLELVQLFYIKLMLDGVAIQPDGMVKVTLPLSDNLKDYASLQVVYIDEDGKVTRILSTVDENEITFMTDHFSYYGIVGTPASNQIPETSNPNNNYVWWMLLVGSLLVIVSGKKKEEIS